MEEKEKPGEASFEQMYRELEATVRQLEDGEPALAEAIRLYEHGVGLARRCQEALDRAQLQIEQMALGPAPGGAVETGEAF